MPLQSINHSSPTDLFHPHFELHLVGSGHFHSLPLSLTSPPHSYDLNGYPDSIQLTYELPQAFGVR